MSGWEELRREIEALPREFCAGDPPVAVVRRADVLAIVDRLAATRGEPPAAWPLATPTTPEPDAARGEPGLDFDRLLAAIEATRLEDPGPWHVDFPKTRQRLAKEIGRNYRAAP